MYIRTGYEHIINVRISTYFWLNTTLTFWIRTVYVQIRTTWFTDGRVEDLLGRVPLIPCFLDGNATSTIPHKYSSRQRDAFECCCADGAGPNSRRGSHVYEINTWLWNFGRPQPRVGGLSVAKTEKIRRKSRSEAAKRAWTTKRARAGK